MNAVDKMLYFLAGYDPDSTGYRVLAELLCQVRRIPGSHINELAFMCYASPATLSRLVKDMGFASFAAFKAEVAACLQDVTPPETAGARVPASDELSDTIRRSVAATAGTTLKLLQTLQQPEVILDIEACARLLKRAGQVCFLVHDTLIFRALQKALFMDGKRADIRRVVESAAPTAQGLRGGDVTIAAVFSAQELAVKREILVANQGRGVHNILVAGQDIPGLDAVAKHIFFMQRGAPHSNVLYQGFLSELLLSAYRLLG